MPGQKLKARIPKNADMEKRCFVLTVYILKVKGLKLKEPQLQEGGAFLALLGLAVNNEYDAHTPALEIIGLIAKRISWFKPLVNPNLLPKLVPFMSSQFKAVHTVAEGDLQCDFM